MYHYEQNRKDFLEKLMTNRNIITFTEFNYSQEIPIIIMITTSNDSHFKWDCNQHHMHDKNNHFFIVSKSEMPQYLQLYPPALDWILQCIAQKSPEVSYYVQLIPCTGQNE